MTTHLPNHGQPLSQPAPSNGAWFDLLGQNSQCMKRIRRFVVHLSQKHEKHFRNGVCGSAGALEALINITEK